MSNGNSLIESEANPASFNFTFNPKDDEPDKKESMAETQEVAEPKPKIEVNTLTSEQELAQDGPSLENLQVRKLQSTAAGNPSGTNPEERKSARKVTRNSKLHETPSLKVRR